MNELSIRTQERSQLVDVTEMIQREVEVAGVEEGLVTLFVPHTTAGITIQENADPDVGHDILLALEHAVPWKSRDYHHAEGNSAAHIKTAMVGNSVQVIVHDGKLALGTWQAIYFCEFDGPRERKLWLQPTA